jgi:hypothetical protein
MARFFGTVQGGRGKATRLGHKEMYVTAQSYSGSVIVAMFTENGEDYVSIGLGNGSTGGSNFSLYSGPVKNLFDDQVTLGGK